jgi:regulator of RNase E activity RraA
VITPEVLAELGKYDTPTICNVIELFNVRLDTAGYMNNQIAAVYPNLPPMVGYAATATCRTAISPGAGGNYSKLTDQVARFEELSGPPVVVFQDLDQPAAAATFGEIMCTTYKAFGAVGLVTNGPGRDIDQVRPLNFPVFTNGLCCSHGYFHAVDIHVPVHVGGIAVLPDDLIHADLNGVTTVPKEIAADVAAVCADYIAAEMVIINAMREGNATVARLKEVAAEKDRLTQEIIRQIKPRVVAH